MHIEITRFDGGLRFKPIPPYLMKYLRYHHREMQSFNYKRECVFVEKMLYSVDGEGYAFTLPGFFYQITVMIHKNHDTYQVTDLRTLLPPIDWNRIKEFKLRDYQIPLVADLVLKGAEDSGVINAAGGIGKTHLAAITYAAWNGLNTILAIPLKEVVRQTYQKFKIFFPEKHVGLVGDGSHDVSNDITITTFKSLKSCAMEKCELLLVDEMQSTGSPTFKNCMETLRPKRMFGFSATTDGLFNNSDKLLVGLFGEDLIYFPYTDAEESGAVVPGVVYMLNMPKDYEFNLYSSIEAKIKHGIKSCVVRHEMIGEVCNKIPEGWQTIIFVDHVKDHLIPLYKYLPPGTKYLHRESSKKSVGTFALTNKQQRDTATEFANNEFQRLIATDAFRAGVDIPNCRVVVQGAGGSSKVEVLQEALRGSRILTQEQKEKFGLTDKTHFVLVDFMDNHDPVLNGMAKKRIQYYKEQGWTIHEVDRVEQIDWHNTGEKKQLK
jgi:superfamily II DNA or RNA helicase